MAKVSPVAIILQAIILQQKKNDGPARLPHTLAHSTREPVALKIGCRQYNF